MHDGHLLEIEGLSRQFDVRSESILGRRRTVQALRDVSFSVRAGEAFGVVGESGSGKSTLAWAIMNIHPPSAGDIRFNGKSLKTLTRRQWSLLRRDVQYVFQDPLAALDPRRSVLFQVTEPLAIHSIGTPDSRKQTAREMLGKVGLGPQCEDRVPHQLSGGQRQRVVLARALILQPKLLICDEPVSALDVSIQAQIVNLLKELWRDIGLTLVFISHDLSLVHYLCERVAVMYGGRICEVGPTQALFSAPRHPYTQALLSAIPLPDPSRKQSPVDLPTEPPDPLQPSSGCAFLPRCPHARAACRERHPGLKPVGTEHTVACHAAQGG